MTAATPRLVAAAAYLLPALVWTVIAHDLWHFRRLRRPRSQLNRLMPYVATCLAVFYGLAVVFALLAVELHERHPWPLVIAYRLSDLSLLSGVALFRHLALAFPLCEQRPSRSWLLGNYGAWALVAAMAAWPAVIPAPDWPTRIVILRIVMSSYIVINIALSLRLIARYAGHGIWRPGRVGEARHADVVILSAGLLGIAVLSFAFVQGSEVNSWTNPHWLPQLEAGIGLGLALPFAARHFGEVTRGVLVSGGTIGGALAIYAGTRALQAQLAGEGLDLLLTLASALLPVLILVPAQAPLRRLADRALFRRTRRRREMLHGALQRLAPDLGADECCRRALSEAAEIMNLRGAGILLDGRGCLSRGAIDMEPLRRAWPSGVAARDLPTYPFTASTFRELPLRFQEALIEADIVGVVPIVSPRRHWGFAFLTTGALDATFPEEDIQALEGYAEQLALVLDASELLDRAVRVERALAHAEKLAAIGELAARVAHEIRNPVTAARSLAQQLADEPGFPFRDEQVLILTELERVERQVAALLRFARREEIHLAAVDLGDLVETTLADLHRRLESEGIAVDLEVRPGVRAWVDREKIRQVLINLIENAIDALTESGAKRRLAVGIGVRNGSGTLRVEDSGPGVCAADLPRIFEPFFSGKEKGTGLGLAIVRRTIEAHGGRIEARSEPGRGLRLDIELPLAPVAPLRD